MPRLFCCLVFVALLVLKPEARAQVDFEDAFPDLPDFDRPVDLQLLPDGARWVVVQQPGLIVSFDDDPAVSAVDTLLDLRDVVDTEPSWEEGMLGLAFHPGYAENGHFFVHYTTYPEEEDGPHRTIIARFTVTSHDPPTADRDSEVVLLDIEQPLPWHNGGQLAFHPLEDAANLYLSLGDGGGGGDPFENAQDRSTLLGSILRIDVDAASGGRNYGIPPDNPFVGNTEGWREEIWAYGLRNPWRFSIDPETGWLWVGDVGQNLWEEVTVVAEAGANLGWDVKEAIFCYEAPDPGEPLCDAPDLIDPVWWYRHEDDNNSITGGHVYRGSAIPDIAGHYVYGDFISGRVWALDFEGLEEPVNTELGRLTHVSTFGVDADGELLVASFDASVSRGRIYRIVRETVAAEPGAEPGEASTLRLSGPNPFRSQTALAFRSARPGPVRIAVYDVLGREIAVLHDGPAPTSEQTVVFEAAGLPAGVYVVRMEAGGMTTSVPLTVVR